MRIVCPACTATYDVPIALLKPGQSVRCARCTCEWVPPAEAEEPAPAPPPLMMPEPVTQEPVTPEPGPVATPEPVAEAEDAPIEWTPEPKQPAAPLTARVSGLRLAWVASLVVLAALVWGAYSQRASIMQAWPPSIRVYAALGLAEGK